MVVFEFVTVETDVESFVVIDVVIVVDDNDNGDTDDDDDVVVKGVSFELVVDDRRVKVNDDVESFVIVEIVIDVVVGVIDVVDELCDNQTNIHQISIIMVSK